MKTFTKTIAFAIIATIVATLIGIAPVKVTAATKATPVVTVTNKKDFLNEVSKKAAATIILESEKSFTLTIKANTKAKNKKIIIDAPKAKVKNYAKFKTITVKNAKTYSERVNSNKITVNSEKTAFSVYKNITVKKLTIPTADQVKLGKKAKITTIKYTKKSGNVTTTPTTTPVVTETPTTIPAPVVTDVPTPVVTPVPVVTEVPTQIPVVTPAPTVTEAPQNETFTGMSAYGNAKINEFNETARKNGTAVVVTATLEVSDTGYTIYGFDAQGNKIFTKWVEDEDDFEFFKTLVQTTPTPTTEQSPEITTEDAFKDLPVAARNYIGEYNSNRDASGQIVSASIIEIGSDYYKLSATRADGRIIEKKFTVEDDPGFFATQTPVVTEATAPTQIEEQKVTVTPTEVVTTTPEVSQTPVVSTTPEPTQEVVTTTPEPTQTVVTTTPELTQTIVTTTPESTQTSTEHEHKWGWTSKAYKVIIHHEAQKSTVECSYCNADCGEKFYTIIDNADGTQSIEHWTIDQIEAHQAMHANNGTASNYTTGSTEIITIAAYDEETIKNLYLCDICGVPHVHENMTLISEAN